MTGTVPGTLIRWELRIVRQVRRKISKIISLYLSAPLSKLPFSIGTNWVQTQRRKPPTFPTIFVDENLEKEIYIKVVLVYLDFKTIL